VVRHEGRRYAHLHTSRSLLAPREQQKQARQLPSGPAAAAPGDRGPPPDELLLVP
jgi:hypothetical protein